MTHSSKRLGVFQVHHTDMMPPAEEFNPVVKLNKSGVFDHVVLAVPDLEENRFLEDYALEWGAEIFFGDVDNITQRIYDVARAYGCDLIARPSIYWFYLDPRLVKGMLDALETAGAEMVLLPRNFDVTFGADVCTIGFLEKMLGLFKGNESLRTEFMRHPWGYAELYPEEVDVLYFSDVPTYDQQRFQEVVASLKQVFPEAGVTADKTYPYRHILKYLRGDEKILDIACGHGAGTAVLANHAAHVVGVDLSSEAIEEAEKQHQALSNITFLQANVFDLSFKPGEFDFIVSIHTMEHIEHDKHFISLISRWLKNGGSFGLEVPLLMDYPFKGINKPMNPYHVREYTVEGLEHLLEGAFELLEKQAVVRGWYTDISRARNAAMMIARKKGI